MNSLEGRRGSVSVSEVMRHNLKNSLRGDIPGHWTGMSPLNELALVLSINNKQRILCPTRSEVEHPSTSGSHWISTTDLSICSPTVGGHGENILRSPGIEVRVFGLFIMNR